jgi:1,4-dihydroxy-2-naphthoate octaprenyltransferase
VAGDRDPWRPDARVLVWLLAIVFATGVPLLFWFDADAVRHAARLPHPVGTWLRAFHAAATALLVLGVTAHALARWADVKAARRGLHTGAAALVTIGFAVATGAMAAQTTAGGRILLSVGLPDRAVLWAAVAHVAYATILVLLTVYLHLAKWGVRRLMGGPVHAAVALLGTVAVAVALGTTRPGADAVWRGATWIAAPPVAVLWAWTLLVGAAFWVGAFLRAPTEPPIPDLASSRWRRVWRFVRLGRPHFLASGFAMFALGALLARDAGHALTAAQYAFGQAFVTATQWHVHYANEYHDRDADRGHPTRTWWSGGSGMLERGVAPRAARNAARGLAIAAILLAAAVLGAAPSARAATAVVVAATFVLAVAYSAPPARLQARGLGIPATLTIVAGLVPALPLAIAAAVPTAAAWVLLPVAATLATFLAVIDLPDRAADAAAGKRTWAVRVGPRAARGVAIALAALAALTPLAAWGTAALWPGIGAAAASVPLIIVLARCDPERRRCAAIATTVALTAFVLAVALALGVLWMSG